MLLQKWSRGDASAFDALVPLVYAELRRQAKGMLRGERAAATFDPTALVHDAFVRLASAEPVAWESRTHFLAVSARAMRRVLVDHARRRDSDKRGGDQVRVGITMAERLASGSEERQVDVLEVERLLSRLERISERRARVVEMRFFAGLEDREIAEVLGISLSTVEREWRTARAFLAATLARGDGSPP